MEYQPTNMRIEDSKKKESECINANQKCYEYFLNANYRLRLLIYDLIYTYARCDQLKMQKDYGDIKDKIKKIELCSNQITTKMKNPLLDTSYSIPIKSVNQFLESRHREQIETQNLSLVMSKMTFVNEMFKGLFDLKEDGIIKDFLKDDFQIQLKASLNDNNRNPTQDNSSFKNIKKDIEKQFPKLRLIYKEKEIPSKYKLLTVYVDIGTAIQISLSLIIDDKGIKINKLCVGAYKEKFNYAQLADPRENKIMPIKRMITDEDKSKYKLFRKLNMLFEEKLNYLLKQKILPNRTVFNGFNLFIVSISLVYYYYY